MDSADPPGPTARTAAAAGAVRGGPAAGAPGLTGADPDQPPVAEDDLAAPDRPARSTPGPTGRRKGSFLRELPFLIVIALGLALLIKAFLLQAFYIPTGSMEQTLMVRDRVLVNKLIYRIRDPHRGEIIVFKGPPGWPAEASVPQPTNPVARFFQDIGRVIGVSPPDEKDFIKRVIGIPGDTVQCCDTQGRVMVNGHPLNETYLYQNEDPQPFGPVHVPPGDLWVMGDHRSQSADSRDYGYVPEKNVIGRAFIIVWPFSRFGTLPVPSTFQQPGLAAAEGALLPGVPYLLGLVGAVPLTTWCRRRRRPERLVRDLLRSG